MFFVKTENHSLKNLNNIQLKLKNMQVKKLNNIHVETEKHKRSAE